MSMKNTIYTDISMQCSIILFSTFITVSPGAKSSEIEFPSYPLYLIDEYINEYICVWIYLRWFWVCM